MSLFKIKLTEPIIKNGKQLQCTYVVEAASKDEALRVLGDDQPEAFRHNPAVEVMPWPTRTVKLACIMVDRPKGGRTYGEVQP